ncbi:putative RNA methyltransferase [Fusibacter sp. A1]|uniref:putative RNA methyltransferase n=1 Tax=Fusibacter sp. A1 TaxID=2283630 RepID=UPI001495125D|nr:methyltransferase domain-containing protein [Fusibacter sp. A1]
MGKLIENSAEKRYECSNGHRFDIAKQGYVNLLMSNQKGSKEPGDGIEMIKARNSFLSKDLYFEVAEKTNEVIEECVVEPNANGVTSILDIGCGEGYYLDKLIRHFETKNITGEYYGMDISKHAVKIASKKNHAATWLVGNNFFIPFENESLNILLSVFSPIKMEECERVLKDQGYFVRLLPNPDHLIELREIIYAQIDDKEKPSYEIEGEKLKLDKEENINYQISLDQEGIQELLLMTPHYWKTSKVTQARLAEYESLDVTVAMKILVFKKNC